MSEAPSQSGLAELTAEIVSAFVSNHQVPATNLGEIIEVVGKRLASLSAEETEPTPVRPEPAVPIRRSVGRDYIICLEDGRKFKLLKRHLSVKYNMTPQQYRERWGLPESYPMVAPSYAEARSELALKTGLGRAARPVKKTRGSRTSRKFATKS